MQKPGGGNGRCENILLWDSKPDQVQAMSQIAGGVKRIVGEDQKLTFFFLQAVDEVSCSGDRIGAMHQDSVHIN